MNSVSAAAGRSCRTVELKRIVKPTRESAAREQQSEQYLESCRGPHAGASVGRNMGQAQPHHVATPGDGRVGVPVVGARRRRGGIVVGAAVVALGIS